MATLWHTCAKVRELSELLFRMLRGVDWGIGVLDGDLCRAWGRGGFGCFCSPIFTTGIFHCLSAMLLLWSVCRRVCRACRRCRPITRCSWQVQLRNEFTVLRRTLMPLLLNRPGGDFWPGEDFRSDAALLPHHCGQTCF